VRKLMWFALGFTASCALGTYFYTDFLLQAAIVVGSVSLFVLMLSYWVRKLRISFVLLLGMAFGLLVFHLQDVSYYQPARDMEKQTQKFSVEVMDYTEVTDNGCAFDGRIFLEGKPYSVRVYLNEYERLEPGHRVSGKFKFYQTIGKSEFYQSEGIFLTAYQAEKPVILRCYLPQWYHYGAIWRMQLKQIIHRSFPEDTAGFAKALLLGDKSGIDYALDTNFAQSGIRHIIAVSGLHVSILFGLIYLLTMKRRFLTALIGIPAVIAFAAVAGFSPSVTRASIMQILAMLALLCNREYDPLTALGFSALTMEIVNPLIVSSVSFQLTMGCMIGIFLFSERIKNWIVAAFHLEKRKGKITSWFAGSVSVTLSAMVFTTPLSAYYFGMVSLVGVVTNLLCLWVVTFIFYGVMLSCVLGVISSAAAGIAGWIVAWPIRYVLTTATFLGQLPMAAVYTESVYIIIWLIICYVLLGIFLLTKKKRVSLFAGAAVFGLACAVLFSWLEPTLWQCHVTVLDVGQGQSVILQGGGKTYLVDCGGDYDEGAADKAAETLLSRGIKQLDGIILTHMDYDHAGGVPYLLQRVETQMLYLPRMTDETGLSNSLKSMVDDTFVVGEDIRLTFEDTSLTIFAPESANSGNESSMCILFQTENCDILVPGDRGFAAEKLLLKDHQLPELEVLVVGHHGSKYATSKELLNQTKPEYAIISAGENNRYGHPAEELLQRLLDFGCQILCTADYGTIVFRR